MDDEVERWVAELRAALGDRLVSAMSYGPRPRPRDRARLCLELDPCDADALREVGRVLAGPIRRGRVAAYVVARGELGRLSDVFALRIHAMRAHHRMLHGPDPLEGQRVGRERLRTAVEQGLRNHQIRLRAQVLLHDDDALGARRALLAVAEGLAEEVLGLEALGVPVDSDVPARLEALRDGGSDDALLVDALKWLGAMVAATDAMEDA